MPSGVRSIALIEIVAFKELEELKRLAIRVLDDPGNRNLKGRLDEAITKEQFMDSILDEISRRSGIPKNKLNVAGKGGAGRPDFVVGIVGTDTRVAVVEVKYVSDVENVKDLARQCGKADQGAHG